MQTLSNKLKSLILDYSRSVCLNVPKVLIDKLEHRIMEAFPNLEHIKLLGFN